MTKGKNLGEGKQGIRKLEVKQRVQPGLFVGTCQVALGLSRESAWLGTPLMGLHRNADGLGSKQEELGVCGQFLSCNLT